MGYNTDFDGILKFTSPLCIAQKSLLEKIIDIDSHKEGEFVNNYRRELGYIQFEITKDDSGIQWDGSEKFYYAVNAVNFIIENMQRFYPDFGLEGELLAQGEDVGDIWHLVIQNGKAVKVTVDVNLIKEMKNAVEIMRKVLRQHPGISEEMSKFVKMYDEYGDMINE